MDTVLYVIMFLILNQWWLGVLGISLLIGLIVGGVGYFLSKD
jgi:hypothetical protein